MGSMACLIWTAIVRVLKPAHSGLGRDNAPFVLVAIFTKRILCASALCAQLQKPPLYYQPNANKQLGLKFGLFDRLVDVRLSYRGILGPQLALEPACGPAVTLQDAGGFAGEPL